MAAVAYTILVRFLINVHGANSEIATAIGDDRKGKISLILYAAAIPLAFVLNWISVALYIRRRRRCGLYRIGASKRASSSKADCVCAAIFRNKFGVCVCSSRQVATNRRTEMPRGDKSRLSEKLQTLADLVEATHAPGGIGEAAVAVRAPQARKRPLPHADARPAPQWRAAGAPLAGSAQGSDNTAPPYGDPCSRRQEGGRHKAAHVCRPLARCQEGRRHQARRSARGPSYGSPCRGSPRRAACGCASCGQACGRASGGQARGSPPRRSFRRAQAGRDPWARAPSAGNDYARSFEVRRDGKTWVFDSFECAIQAVAPRCVHCSCVGDRPWRRSRHQDFSAAHTVQRKVATSASPITRRLETRG